MHVELVLAQAAGRQADLLSRAAAVERAMAWRMRIFTQPMYAGPPRLSIDSPNSVMAGVKEMA